jgi:hypothetical protein
MMELFAEGADKSSISWSLDLSDTDLSVKSVELDVESSVFESGRVIWQLCGGNLCLMPLPGKADTCSRRCCRQGGQIRLFVWCLYILGRFLKIIKEAHTFGLLFPQVRLCFDFDKKWLGLHFGRTLGHPGCRIEHDSGSSDQKKFS